MALLSLLWRALKSVLVTAVLVMLFAAILVGYRVLSHGQEDNREHLAAKRSYLEQLEKTTTLPADAPNLVFFLYDDMGYGDIGAGADHTMIDTPNIDRLAAEGIVLSDFHSPAPVCTPSRAGYLTGRLAPRAGLPNVVFPTGSTKALVFSILAAPGSNVRLPAEEITLADVLGAAGYATGMVGKWHLGDRSPSLPNDMGFDSYYGALYSNDMEPFGLYRDRDIAVPAPVDQRYLTEQYTEAATTFIQDNAGQPFFLYFAHNFPHDPLFVREERSGQSSAGLFGDVLEEIDDSVGTVVNALRAVDALDNTLIIIASDNGPWYLGDAGNLRGRKGNTFEGGMRVPFIAHWPARIDSGSTSHAMAMGTDLLPTMLDILDLPGPPDRVIDGRSIRAVLTENASTPHDYLYYYDGETLFAARDQRFKYRGPAGVFYTTDQMPVGGAIPQKEWLFDLAGSPRESYDTSTRHQQKLQELRNAFNAKKAEMDTNQRGWISQ
ncbi:MAG: sulfatase family protein [Halioglobus sp.]